MEMNNARVEREKHAHDVIDVLAKSKILKDKFNHTKITPAMQALEAKVEGFIQSSRGKKVLDYGCGVGETSLRLLEQDAHVTGIDISQNYISTAEKSAQDRRFSRDKYRFEVMDAHHLGYEEESFDLVMGRGILHHLEINHAITEVRRVLKPGGFAVFIEPLADNPLLRLFRRLTPQARTADEQPLSKRDILEISNNWEDYSEYYGIICAPVAAITSFVIPKNPNNFFIQAAWKMEQKLNKNQYLRTWNQYVLLTLVKI